MRPRSYNRSLHSAFWATASADWRRRMSPAHAVFRLPSTADDGAWAALSVGDEVELTPLHVARFLQAIGNDGIMHTPTVEHAFVDRARAGERVMSAATARRLRDAMRLVVREGTARSASHVLGDARWTLGGKTGSVKSSASGASAGWFAGLLFDEGAAPRYAIVVYLHGGRAGSGDAARVAADLTRLMGGVGAERVPGGTAL